MLIRPILFLFHTGSIKSHHPQVPSSESKGFLFHTGSIKRPLESLLNKCQEFFYSILVRLKGGCTGCIASPIDPNEFLFHTGSIKRRVVDRLYIPIVGFYSILVRLKDAGEGDSKGSREGFLFHTGSIKSLGKTFKHSIQKNVSIPYWFD